MDNILDLFTPEEFTTLKTFMEPKQKPKGHILIERGSTNRDLFLILTGTYEIYEKLTIARKECALRVAKMEGPRLFGEINLFLKQERSATVVLITDSKYFRLPYENFEKIQKEHPHIASKLLAFAGYTISLRFVSLQKNFHNKMIESADNPQQAMLQIKRFVGEVRMCSPELAKKLFGIEHHS